MTHTQVQCLSDSLHTCHKNKKRQTFILISYIFNIVSRASLNRSGEFQTELLTLVTNMSEHLARLRAVTTFNLSNAYLCK